jgi:hypothetical protein
MISSRAGAIGSQLSELRGEKPLIPLRCCIVKGLQKSLAEVMRHRESDLPTISERRRMTSQIWHRKGTPDKSRGSRLGRLLIGHLRAKKLPYWSDGEQAIPENLAHQPAEDGATDDGDAQDGDDDTS